MLTLVGVHASMCSMFGKVVSILSAEASGDRAFESVSSIARFHRIQASPGFREAACYSADVMQRSSDRVGIIHYPAEDGARFWHFPSFEEWSGRRGILKVTAPDELAGRLADFEACPISLIQRSAPTPPGGLATDIVYAGSGERPADYGRTRGGIALVDAFAPHMVYDAAVKAGVRGIIIYRQKPVAPVRSGTGIRGIRPYCSFWWDERDLFGFVLTPEDGERLVSYLRSPAARRRPVRAWAMVDGERYPGTMEVVTSLIPGREQKEVVLIAHLCHPQPSAGDNASGVAVALEVHRLLSELIRCGRLPQPRYGIRFLLVPEISGTFAYLARSATAGNLVMGLNLDMVGQKQDVTGSTLCIERPPMASACFGPHLLAALARAQFGAGANPGGTAFLPLIKWAATPFSGGSDHAILSDPTVGVPTPMLIQWPDRYYHTSGDRPENISPDLLGRVAVVAAAFIYLCALADETDLLGIAALAGRGLRKEIIDELAGFEGSPAADWIGLGYKARVLRAAGRRVLKSVRRLAPESARIGRAVAREEAALSDCLKREAALAPRGSGRHVRTGAQSRAGALDEVEGMVVKRLSRGPVDPRGLARQLPGAKRARFLRRIAKEDGVSMIGTLGLYWADGRRSVAEISRLVAAELGRTDPAFLKFYFGLLEDAGLVDLVSR